MPSGFDEALAERIIALEKQRGAALVAGDADAVDAMLSDDCVYIHSHGGFDSKASYMTDLRSGRYRFLKCEYEDLEVRIYHGLVAILVGRMRNEVNVEGIVNANDFRIHVVWARPRRDSDDWRFTSFSVTRNSEGKPARA